MVMAMDESVAKLYCPDPACTSMMMMMTLMMTMMVLMIIRTKQVTMKMLMMIDER